MEIRSVTDADWESISEIYNSVRREQFPWISHGAINADDVLRDTDGEDVHVGFEGEQLVGFVSVWRPDSFIHHLFVALPFQGHGVGEQLLRFACDTYPSPLRLKCVKVNERAVRFYDRNRWIVVDEGTSEDGVFLLMEYSKPNKASHHNPLHASSRVSAGCSNPPPESMPRPR